jgi:hypothetical protein
LRTRQSLTDTRNYQHFMEPEGSLPYTVELGLNSIKCNNVFSNKIKPLHVSANDGHHRKATNTSEEMLHMYYMHVVLYELLKN